MEKRTRHTWKRNNVVLAFLLGVYILLIFIFSNNYSIKDISFTSNSSINISIKKDLIGKSIHMINIDQVVGSYLLDPNIEKVRVEKIYPDELHITIDKYVNLALITDLRTNTPMYSKLYKNGDIVEVDLSELKKKDLNGNSIIIENGPLALNIYGEFVNYFLLLNSTDEFIITNFVLVGDSLTGSIGDLLIDFVNPKNLGKKASAVYQRIKEPCLSKSLIIDLDELLKEVIVICNI